MTMKYHYYGSPVVFSERGLYCTFEELENTVRSYYDNFRTRRAERENDNLTNETRGQSPRFIC